ncbi:restriction endonuclease subunit S [Lacticaseibacillus paracasei]|uniref:restriction endonuclease subunit S n=1 Tax=Lacticaseibacillus paracasei TaxID=1597 RepID=UPI0020199ECE|nr:restriction endonuclease subunit S [Lacticaseibacillus paracasei]MCL4175871.1 restriction endonuclease subunit S [Lacticaseibacillus paracasei]
MSANQTKYPQLRFKGFTDPWEERKLADVVSISAGGDVDKTKLIEDGGYPVLANALTNSGIVGYYDSYKVEAPAVTVTGRGDVGHAVARHVNFTPVVRLLSLKSEVLDADFLANMLNQTNILVESTGVPQLTAPQLGSYKILYPNLNEQTKIGKLLNAFDNLIALHQRKLAKLKELKQGYLQKLFPQNGSKFPQLRFAGFADAWEQRKLGEEAQLTMGQSPNSENYTKNPDDYILVQGNADMKNGRVVPRVWTTQITKKAEKSDLILSVRAPVGDIGKTDYDVVLGRGVAAIKGNEFIFQQLGKMKLTGYWTRYSTGSTFESINSNDIKDAKIMVPVEEEQQKIGSFFQQLDHLITLHQRKLEKLQELKKGYLQKMFC